MPAYTKKDIIEFVKGEGVKFIRLQFTDIFGVIKNVAVTADHIERILDNKCMFDGSSIDGFVRIEESDMYLYPDLSTFKIFPWRPQTGKVARMICDVYNPDDTPFEGNARYILKKALEEMGRYGFDAFNIGPECEFFLFHTDAEGNPTISTHDRAGYFDLGPSDMGENARRDICLVMEDMGFEIESSHHEVASGQHEIVLKKMDALTSADAVITLRLVVKTIAQRYGLHATFMPKPLFGQNGSGMHINASLFKNGENIFYDSKSDLKLSNQATCFIGGVMKHIRSLSLITNPTVNSYKRLVAGFEAPVHIAWAVGNRSLLLRIPYAKGKYSRLELRNPDSSCNPYLAYAGILQAGLDGIKNKTKPPEPVDFNIYELSEEKIKSKGIDSLPSSLLEAIDEFSKSKFMREIYGQHLFDRFVEAKNKEWNEYSRSISKWEIDNYLSKY